MIFNKKKGFTLAESLVFLLVTALVMAATMPIMTRKHLKPGKKVPHGKWACKLINGRMMQATAGSASSELPPDEHWQEGCEFPDLPGSVKYVLVKVIGAGAAGSSGNITVAQKNDVDKMFATFEEKYKVPKPSNEPVTSTPFVVKNTGNYRVRLEGGLGSGDKLHLRSVKREFNDVTVADPCFFEETLAREDVPYVEFDYELFQNDVLTLYSDCSNIAFQFNGGKQELCDDSKKIPIKVDGIDVEFNFAHNYITSHGYNGCSRSLYLNRDGAAIKLATVPGGGGAYYYSNPGVCEFECKYRYQPVTDRLTTVYKSKDELKKLISVDSDAENIDWGTDYPQNTSISMKSPTIEAYGGCGGAAGQVNTVLMMRPEKGEVPTIRLGKYSAASAFERSTQFGSVVAAGASPDSCSSQGISNTYDGRSGDSAADRDSIGGAGGTGASNNSLLKASLLPEIFDLIKVGATIKEQERYRGCVLTSSNKAVQKWCGGKYVDLNGQNGIGIGSGGGGGGVVFAIEPVEGKSNQEVLLDFIKSDDFYSYEDIKFVGGGGKGTSGGIVVSW